MSKVKWLAARFLDRLAVFFKHLQDFLDGKRVVRIVPNITRGSDEQHYPSHALDPGDMLLQPHDETKGPAAVAALKRIVTSGYGF